MKTAFERMQSWVGRALEVLVVDKDEAWASAYEAGRYGFEMPALLAQHPDLVEAYQRGQQDAVADADAEGRFDSLADAFPDWCPAL